MHAPPGPASRRSWERTGKPAPCCSVGPRGLAGALPAGRCQWERKPNGGRRALPPPAPSNKVGTAEHCRARKRATIATTQGGTATC